jgi:hypothetical protein
MRNRFLPAALICSVLGLAGCVADNTTNRNGTGSADNQGRENRPNGEKGEPPGSRKGGVGPAAGAPVAGDNPNPQASGSNSAQGNPAGGTAQGANGAKNGQSGNAAKSGSQPHQ